jgi:two-component system LytT family response regulator
MIKILIVDDEAAASNILKILIQKFISVPCQILVSNNPEEALSLIRSDSPTLLMLDIEMPGTNGFDLLNRAIENKFDVIFTTAHNHYAIKAIRFSALDYLLKPIDALELQNAINRHIIRHQNDTQQLLMQNLITNLQKNDSNDFKLALSTMDGVFFYEPAEIIYCEGKNNYTHFYFNRHKPLLVSKTLGEYEDMLKDHGFLRIHKSFLVNRKYVTKVTSQGGLEMKDGTALPISMRRKESIMSALKNQ